MWFYFLYSSLCDTTMIIELFAILIVNVAHSISLYYDDDGYGKFYIATTDYILL